MFLANRFVRKYKNILEQTYQMMKNILTLDAHEAVLKGIFERG